MKNKDTIFDSVKKELINESLGYVDLQLINNLELTPKADYENKFAAFLAEEAKVVEKKTTKEVEETQEHNFDYSNKSNLDNQIGQEVLNGIHFESKQNPDKDLEEIRKIVSKNLEKDSQYYMKNAAFGVDGLGYEETEVEEVSGKHKESGYSDKLKKMVKESLIGELDITNEEKEEIEEKPKPKKPKKAKKESVDSKLAEIDKQGQIVAMEAKLDALAEMIESKLERINMVSEDENLSELIDKAKMKELQKAVKLLEKRKTKMEKMYEKLCGRSYTKEAIIDETQNEDE